MRVVLIDVEANGFLPLVNTLWCICTEDTTTGEKRDWVYPIDEASFYEYAKTVDRWVIHNGSSYDGPVLQKLLPSVKDFFTTDKIIDTLVISRTTDYARMMSHSLKNWGLMLGCWKGDWEDFSKFHPDMVGYCRQDVNVLKKVWLKLKRYCIGPAGSLWKDSFTLEKETNLILSGVQQNGFSFNTTQATELLSEIQEEMLVLEAEFQKQWPPQLVLVKKLKYRVKADGTEFKSIVNARMSYPKAVRDGKLLLLCYDFKPFEPSSPTMRIDRLWEAGWNPITKTKGHAKFLKNRETDPVRKKKFETYGWMCNEDNLNTLPQTAPKAASDLAKWLTLEGRRSSLREWLGQVQEDGKIHGNVMHIGAWTHRCSHSGPNTANISRPWPEGLKPKTAVEVVKSVYDSKLRSCWVASKDSYLVGTDADGIQLRVLSHYMGSQEYVDAIVRGDKALETDIHNLNKKALGSVCKSRDDAKTFIYAWLLGAGVMKVSSILGCSIAQAQQAVQNFLASLPELARVKNVVIPRDAARGYFIGLDGRRVVQPQAYLMLAGYLQNGEALLMKKAMCRWHKEVIRTGINFKQVGFIHDEWQTEVYGTKEEAEHIGKMQCEALTWAGEELGLFCPITGTSDIGLNWLETH